MPATRACAVELCDRPISKRDWCNRHYLRWRRHGDPLAGRPPWDEFTMPTEKACRRCGEVKPLELFATRSAARDGKSPWCKACGTAYYHETSDERAAYRERWVAENPDYFRRHYLANRAKRIAQAREWYRNNPDRVAEWTRRYWAANRQRLNAKSREYQRRIGHKYSRARRIAERTQVVDVVDRRIVFERGGGNCGICLKPVDLDTFHVDHIIPIARGGEHSYANTQPAHPVCNMRKGARLAA